MESQVREHMSTRMTESGSATNHSTSHARDAVVERVTATTHVVELGLRHALYHLPSGDEQLSSGDHLFQLEDSCGRFLNDADDRLQTI